MRAGGGHSGSSGTPNPLDTTFNGQHNNAAGGNSDDVGYSVAVSGTQIVVSGNSINGLGDGDMVIWRYNANGTLDTTFNGQGWVVHDNAAGGDNNDKGNSVAIDANGKIVVAGNSLNASNNLDMVIWQYR